MTHSFDLEFNKEQIDCPYKPTAKIFIKISHSDDKNKDRKYITCLCHGIKAFEYEINRLKKELDDILDKAKSNFA